MISFLLFLQLLLLPLYIFKSWEWRKPSGLFLFTTCHKVLHTIQSNSTWLRGFYWGAGVSRRISQRITLKLVPHLFGIRSLTSDYDSTWDKQHSQNSHVGSGGEAQTKPTGKEQDSAARVPLVLGQEGAWMQRGDHEGPNLNWIFLTNNRPFPRYDS